MVRVAIGVHVHAEPARLPPTLASITRNSSGAEVELMVIPVGADDETRAATAEVINTRVLDDLGARGGAACFNRLLAASDTEIVIMLESGCIVGPGAIEKLVAALQQPRVGLAGPSTNRAWNDQRVFENARAEDVAETAAEAERRFGATTRTLAPLYSLADFCYAARREVFDAIGPADESYGLGPCWEMDYNIRAARAGFDGLWVCAAYVWRPEPSERRAREEAAAFEASKRRYQDKFCGARLRGQKHDYRDHCRGDACPNFAPRTVAALPVAAAAASILTPVSSSDAPLVSCIMPTYNRRTFIPDALRCFFAQDHPNIELIVVDDGSDSIADLLPGDDRILYFRLTSRLTVGAKRNYACERARGSIIVHWDDDDWYPASRVRVQAAALAERGADVCGSSILYFYDRGRPEAFLYQYSGGGSAWVAGTTLAYRREFWQRNRFPDLQVGEDTQFVWRSHGAKIVDLKDPGLCVAAVHPGNVSPKQTRGVFWSSERVERVRELMAAGSPPSAVPSQPLVPCVMPTYNRPEFIPLALECFRGQSYRNRELIVVDDGDRRVGDLLRDEPAVRYVHVGRRVSVGAKRNRGCAEARGEIIALWDDDDWYSPRRLQGQVAPILRNEADITGLVNRFVLQLPQRKCWTVSGPLHRSMFVGDVPGGTVVFRRSIWAGGICFPEINLGEDAAFLRLAMRRGKRLLRVDDESLFVYVRHGSNTWRFETGTFLSPSGWSESMLPAGFSARSLDAYAAAADAHAMAAGGAG
ncbi:MAG TPA: glycosyltransferase [Thermoanaerobaculia bacterium]|nr:glycosyltransferase [Thermoanaerobaculia bacterium]